MNTTFSRILALVSAVLIGVSISLTGSGFALAQDPPEAPVATPDPSLATRFALNPVGENGASYFDDVEVLAGTSVTLEASLLNFGDSPVNLRLYLTTATSGANGGYVAGPRDAELHGSATWITYPDQEMTLQPGETVIIPFTVNVPAGTAPGQYISSLVAETEDTFPIPGVDLIDQRIRFAMAVGILVPGEMHQSFTLGEPIMNRENIVVPITNTGNYLVRPAGTMELTDSEGEVVFTSPVELGSVYAGLTTDIAVRLPVALEPGDYTLLLTLEDSDSGATAAIQSATLTVMSSERPAQFTLGEYAIEPNAEEIAFANVTVTLDNAGQQIAAANVTLIVSRDGKLVEKFPLASSQVLVNGENVLSARYIPATDWEAGTYTFEIVVESMSPEGQPQAELLNVPLEAEIIIP